jgi:dipeptidyl aminopeptidase/acylaminoacyl peptidase
MEFTPQSRPVDINDLFRLTFITSAQLSPDGKQAVYGLQTADLQKDEIHTSLWLLGLENGETRQLTSGTSDDFEATFSPDGKKVAFLSTRSGIPQIYIIPVDGGEALPLTHLSQPVGSRPIWSQDGKWIAFTAGPKSAPPDPKKPYRVNRFVYRFNGIGYLDPVVQDIYILSSEGGEPKLLTNDRCSYRSLAWSPNGRELLCLQMMQPDTNMVVYPRMMRINLQGKMKNVLSDWGCAFSANWLPGGNEIAFIGQPWGKSPCSKFDLWVTDLQGKAPKCRTASLDVGVYAELQADFPDLHGSGSFISPDGKAIYLNVLKAGSIRICKISLHGQEKWQFLTGGERTFVLLGVSKHGLFYGVSSLHTPFDLYTSKLDGSQEKQRTDINRAVLSTWAQPDVEHLLFKGQDGIQVEGWLLTPSKGTPPYPTILYNHGGPHLAYGYIFNFDFQLLAGAGFAVLFINYRGSTGYGDDYSTAILGDLGNLDYQDLMTGVDHVIAKGLADPDRLGCCGLSYGGFLSCWIVGHTERFKAAVPENPVSNWLSLYGTSDEGSWLAAEELGGPPHEVPEIYARCSPITYAHKCTTPTLLVQGEADYRCPPEQSEQFYTMLKANDCTVEMLRLPNSSHMGSIYGAPSIRHAQNEALLEWMIRYVLGKTNQP